MIGGHSKPVNKASIGIAILGDYEHGELPAPVLKNLIALITQKSRQYKIDINGKTEYKDEVYNNVHGHNENSATLCPGAYLKQKLSGVKILALYRRFAEKTADPVMYDFRDIEARSIITTEPNEEKAITVRLKNNGTVIWGANTFLEHIDDTEEDGIPKIVAHMETQSAAPGGLGVFKGTLPKFASSGLRVAKLGLVINGSIRPNKTFPLPVMVEAREKPVRVALSFKGTEAQIKSESGIKIYSKSSLVRTVGKNITVSVSRPASGKYSIKINDTNLTVENPPKFKANGGGILELVNFENRPAWNKTLNDNLYRGALEVNFIDAALVVINELQVEDYLRGIAEISNGDPQEKIKTIIILARSYAKYYRDIGRKFPDKPYDLDDDPDHTQKYLGYGFEKRASNISAAVDATRGQIVTYQGKAVITPYFTQSDGRTRSAEEVWGWTDRPYLKSVPDAFCGSMLLRGHGVGLSGCGATALAKQGKSAQEIIKYYYSGVEITDEK